MSTGVTIKHLLRVRAWTPGQHPTPLVCYITQRKHPASSLTNGTNPDLAFVSFSQGSRLPDRRVLGKFPRSQQWPSIIALPKLKVPTHSDPVKHWNFLKADWICEKALLPSHKWIRWEIATSRHIKYWEGIPGFSRELYFCGQTMYPTWLSEELCSMLGQRVQRPPSLLYLSTSGDWLWYSRFVPTISAWAGEAGVMGGSCKFNRLLAL